MEELEYQLNKLIKIKHICQYKNAPIQPKNYLIHLASEVGSCEEITKLIKHGTPINAKNSEGDTPLHFAMRHKQTDAVELLKKLGADVNAMNYQQQIPSYS